jgi:FtsP/CotA-like multicopper oxidase with cupredoxin domain
MGERCGRLCPAGLRIERELVMTTDENFTTSLSGLEGARLTPEVALAHDDTFELRIAPVSHRIGADTVRMLAYSGSIPGPTLRVKQGSEVNVRVVNDSDGEATVHWHGLRLENRYDGVPYETQEPIPVGGEFTYRLQFPDEGIYWYHPHIREDYGLELGLYGNIVVEPADPDCWAPVNRDFVITLDDVLVEDGAIAPFSRSGPTHTAMGRFGNVMFTSGVTDLRLSAREGEVVRLFLTNTANTRIFNVSIQGARMKLVGGDSGRVEHETFVDAVLLAPSERAVVDVLCERAGAYPLEHRTPDGAYVLGTIAVEAGGSGPSFVDAFEELRTCAALVDERRAIAKDLGRPPDKTLTFIALMPILYGRGGQDAAATAWTCPMHPEVVAAEPGTCPKCGMKLIPAAEGVDPSAGDHGHHGHDAGDGLEWEDLMPDINRQTDATNMIWKLVDQETGNENVEIDWAFEVGDRVKIRLVNTMESEHPMHHPFHIHGAGRFLVLARDGVEESNLGWKDTVLVRAGETVDILLDVTNEGRWMAHCHIAEHNQVGMMFSFDVTEPA